MNTGLREMGSERREGTSPYDNVECYEAASIRGERETRKKCGDKLFKYEEQQVGWKHMHKFVSVCLESRLGCDTW